MAPWLCPHSQATLTTPAFIQEINVFNLTQQDVDHYFERGYAILPGSTEWRRIGGAVLSLR